MKNGQKSNKSMILVVIANKVNKMSIKKLFAVFAHDTSFTELYCTKEENHCANTVVVSDLFLS